MNDPQSAACENRTAIRNRLALGAALILVFALYRVTAIPWVVQNFDFPYSVPGQDYYNRQARALLAGKTSLLERPHPALLALDDPYDPAQNHLWDGDGNALCLHDVSLYNGKYYLYYGVTPAVTLFVPALLLSGQYLSAAAATLVFSFGAAVWSVLLLNLLADRFLPAVGARTRFFFAIVVGCCNCFPFLLRSPFHYEVAITAAQFFTMGGLYFLARGCPDDRLRRGSVAMGSLFLGLAIGCRPHMAAVGVLGMSVVGIAFLCRARAKTMSKRDLSVAAATLAGPWLVSIGLLGWYNYHRFHSFTDFGASYNLIAGPRRLPDQKLLDPGRLKADLYCYLFLPPYVIAKFPYIQLPDPPESLFPSGNLGHTPIAGSLVGLPFRGVLALAPVTLARAYRAGRYGFVVVVTALIGAGVGELLVVACFSAAMRYTADFAGFLVLASLLVLVDLDAWSRPRASLRRPLRVFAAAALTAGCLFNLGISVEGQDRLLPRDFAVRDRLREIFPPLPFITGPVTAKMRVVFPERAKAGRCEPLVVTGEQEKADFVYVRYLGNDTVAFAFDHWGHPAQFGEAVRVETGRPHDLDIELRCADSRVVCRLDGHEVLTADSPIYRFPRSSLRVGYNLVGGGLFSSDVFMGQISETSLHVPPVRH
jgi:hypothetical protein